VGLGTNSPLLLVLIVLFLAPPAANDPVPAAVPFPFPFFSNEPDVNVAALGEVSESESCTPLLAAAA
jgi:hypothetical protein